MSWTRITGEPEEFNDEFGWVGCYFDDEWRQWAAVYDPQRRCWRHARTASLISSVFHLTHFTRFKAPEPPPKAVSVREAGNAMMNLLLKMADGQSFCSGEWNDAIVDWREAITCEEVSSELVD